MVNYDVLKMSYNRETTKTSNEKRTFNVIAFSELSRKLLEFGKYERRLILYTTSFGEQISIQYPGKESKSGTEDKIRPWDFRPKLTLQDGNDIKDLSFPNIWDDLSDLHNMDDSVLELLATIFFRMSVMVDHVLDKSSYQYTDYNIISKSTPKQGYELFKWYKYTPDEVILNHLSKRISNVRGASLEAYLYYNDLLVQNEDCKYYYRDENIKRVKWNSKSGRNNTLLSHLSVIEFLKGEITFSEIMTRFQRGMGVAPIAMKELETVTGGLITKL